MDFQTIWQGTALQEKLARVPEGSCALAEIRRLEIVLAPYQVVSDDQGNAIVHCGPASDQQLILLSNAGQYDVITKLNAYFGVT